MGLTPIEKCAPVICHLSVSTHAAASKARGKRKQSRNETKQNDKKRKEKNLPHTSPHQPNTPASPPPSHPPHQDTHAQHGNTGSGTPPSRSWGPRPVPGTPCPTHAYPRSRKDVLRRRPRYSPSGRAGRGRRTWRRGCGWV